MSVLNRRRTAWALLLLLPALFGVNILLSRYAMFVPPNALALGRWVVVVLFLSPFVGAGLLAHRRAIAREWPDLLLLGALGMWVCGAFVYIGARSTVALNISLIYAASPILIVILERVFHGESLPLPRLVGITLCLGGVAIVLTRGQLASLLSVRFTVGDLWVATASACWGIYSVILRYRPSALAPMERLSAIAVGGCVVLLPFAVGEALLWNGPDLADWRIWIVWLVLGIVPGVGAYGAYSFCVRELGAGRTSVAMYLTPPYVGIGAWLALGEPPQWYHLVGTLLILPGLYLATRQTPASRAPDRQSSKGA